MKTNLQLLVAAGLLSLAGASFACTSGDHANVAADGTFTAGEVRKVNVAQRKITIKHEAIGNLHMPAMTMVFRTDSPSMISGLKVGDRIRFQAMTEKTVLYVTQIERAQ